VLLKNDGTLPLKPGAHKRIAVIGPNAAVARLGGYSSIPRQAVSLLDGVKAHLGARAQVEFAQGVFITQSEDRSSDEVLLADPVRNRALIAEAVALAGRSISCCWPSAIPSRPAARDLPKTTWVTAPASIWWASRTSCSRR
jgi:beta-glucosidase